MEKPEKEQFTLRVSSEIANKLREIAMAYDKSTTQVIVDILKEKLKTK
jgi:predicted transcriptional regulator